jgi:ABC-2 type transport system permease protein
MSKAATLVEFHLRSMWNWRSLYYGRVLEPLVFFSFLVAGVGGLTGDVEVYGSRLPYLVFAFPGVVALLTLRAWATTVADVANDRKWGVYALARIRGLGLRHYAASIVAAGSVVAVTQAVLVYVLLCILAHGLGAGRLLAMALGMGLSLASWLCFGVALGMAIDSYHRRDLVLSLATLPLAFTAPLFWRVEAAPAYLRTLSLANPLRYHVSLLRGLLVGHVDVAALAVTGACLPVALGVLAWSGRRAELLSGEHG